MTATSSPRRRGASLALSGIFVVAGTLLASAPLAAAAPSTSIRTDTPAAEGSASGWAIVQRQVSPAMARVAVERGAGVDIVGCTMPAPRGRLYR